MSCSIEKSSPLNLISFYKKIEYNEFTPIIIIIFLLTIIRLYQSMLRYKSLKFVDIFIHTGLA